MSQTYRAGIIGCGSIGRHHASGYLGARDVELVAIADSHPAALRDFADQFDIPETYATYEQMLAEARLDLVSVCLWHGLHAPATIACAEAGVAGIICEKPMATNLGEADAMIAAAEKSGSKLAIGHQRRFLESWNAARDLVQSGAIGEPLLLWGRIRDGLLNWGTHVIDGMRYVLGDPAAAWIIGQTERRTDRYERGVRIEDRCVGLWAWENGVRGLLEADLEEKGPDITAGGFVICGTRGTIDLKEQHYVLNGVTHSLGEGRSAFGQAHVEQAEELVAWLRGEREHRCRAEIARPTMELLMGVYDATRQRGQVHLPLAATDMPLDDLVTSGRRPVEEGVAYDIRDWLRRQK